MDKASNVIKTIMFVSIGILGGYLLFKEKMEAVVGKFTAAVKDLEQLLDPHGNILGRVQKFIRRVTPDFSLTGFASAISLAVGYGLQTIINSIAFGLDFLFRGDTQDADNSNVFVYLCRRILSRTAQNITEKSTLMKVLSLFGIKMTISVDTRINLKKYIKFGGVMHDQMKEVSEIGTSFMKGRKIKRYLPNVTFSLGDENTGMIGTDWQLGWRNAPARWMWGANMDKSDYEDAPAGARRYYYDSIDKDYWESTEEKEGIGQKMANMLKIAVEDAGGFVADNIRTDNLQMSFPDYNTGMSRLSSYWGEIKDLYIDSDKNQLEYTYYRGLESDDGQNAGRTQLWDLKRLIQFHYNTTNPSIMTMQQKMRKLADEIVRDEETITIYDIARLMYMATVSKLLRFYLDKNKGNQSFIDDLSSGKMMYYGDSTYDANGGYVAKQLRKNPFLLMRQRLKHSAKYNQMKDSFVQRTKEKVMSGGLGISEAFKFLDFIFQKWQLGLQMFKGLDFAEMNVIDFGWWRTKTMDGLRELRNAKRHYQLRLNGNSVRINDYEDISGTKSYVIQKNIREQKSAAKDKNTQYFQWESTNKIFGQIIYYAVESYNKRKVILRQRYELINDFRQVFDIFLSNYSLKDGDKIVLTDKEFAVLVKYANNQYTFQGKKFKLDSSFMTRVSNQCEIKADTSTSAELDAAIAEMNKIQKDVVIYSAGGAAGLYTYNEILGKASEKVKSARARNDDRIETEAVTKFGFGKL